VVNPSHKILAIEEDTTKINDGAWWTGTSEYPSKGTSSVSVVHDRNREFGNYETETAGYWQRGRGNVVFADGHGEFLLRWYTRYEAYMMPDYNGPVEVPHSPGVR
jgi:prepilin-type processing-associated H-X9-DG protein